MRTLAAVLLLALSAPAHAAGKICSVDFQKAVTSTDEGKAAQTNIDQMYATRKAELERMQNELDKAIKDYQGRAMILSADAKAQEEQKLALQQQTFERTYGQYQQEMQQTYTSMLGDLDQKMRAIATTVGQGQGCSVVLDAAVVVWASNEVGDITDELVTKYNAQHPATAPRPAPAPAPAPK